MAYSWLTHIILTYQFLPVFTSSPASTSLLGFASLPILTCLPVLMRLSVLTSSSAHTSLSQPSFRPPIMVGLSGNWCLLVAYRLTRKNNFSNPYPSSDYSFHSSLAHHSHRLIDGGQIPWGWRGCYLVRPRLLYFLAYLKISKINQKSERFIPLLQSSKMGGSSPSLTQFKFCDMGEGGRVVFVIDRPWSVI